MYSKQEASQLRQQFWTAFGQYMLPVTSAEGEKTNWTNYKTGEKDIYFRMNADNKKAWIAIELTHKDAGVQSLLFDQFKQLQPLLQAALKENWTWHLHTLDEQERTVSRVFTELHNVNLFNKNDWPELISFFKPRIVALDEFWSTAKYVFEALR